MNIDREPVPPLNPLQVIIWMIIPTAWTIGLIFFVIHALVK